MRKVTFCLASCLLAMVLLVPAVSAGENEALNEALVVSDYGSLGGAVDENAFREAINGWVARCNAYVDTFKTLPADKADSLLVSNPPEDVLHSDASLIRLEEVVQPLMMRWSESWDKNNLSDDDRKVIAVLKQYGLLLDSAEGYAFLMMEEKYFNNLLKPYLSQGMQEYLTIQDSQPQYFASDAAGIYSVEKMGGWAVEWERYLSSKPTGMCMGKAKERYEFFMDYILFSTMDNTPAFPRSNGGKMEVSWRNALDAIASQYPDTQTASIITKFLDAIKANNYKLSTTIQNSFTTQISAVGQ